MNLDDEMNLDDGMNLDDVMNLDGPGKIISSFITYSPTSVMKCMYLTI
jgi:hypothetical protein